MIITLTPNPSLDRTVEVERLARGGVIRALGGRVDPGGKGVNVSRVLAAHDRPTTAVLPLGGGEGHRLADLLALQDVALHTVSIAGAVRANITVVEPDGTTTKINEPGPNLAPAEVRALLETAVSLAASSRWVVGCGSLPPGTTDDLYARLVTALRGHPVQVAVDTSGPALRLAVEAGPDLVKPNREELAEVTGTKVITLGDAISAAGKLRSLGAAAVLGSLGADGAILVDAHGTLHGEARMETPCSTVGAGDAMLAGYLSASGDRRTALASALAWGAAATALPGSRMPAPDDVAAVTVAVHAYLDRDRVLDGAA